MVTRKESETCERCVAAEARAVQAEQACKEWCEDIDREIEAVFYYKAKAEQAEQENAKLVLIADLVNHFHNGIRDVEAETVLGRIADVLGPPMEAATSHPAIGKSSLTTPELGSATLSASSSTVGPVHRVPNMGQDTYRPSATPALRSTPKGDE